MPTHPYVYPVPLLKRSGGGPLATGQRNIFVTDADPNNPDNNQYIPVNNASNFPSIVVAGAKSPRVGLHSCLKPRVSAGNGWSDADIFNSLVHVDTGNNTDDFAMAFADEVETRIYDHMRCDRLDFAGHAQGGPQTVFMGFQARWGDQDGPYNTTLPSGEVVGAAPTFSIAAGVGVDAGQALPSAFVNIVGIDKVMTYQLSYIRGQAARYYFGSGPGPGAIVSTMFSGLMTVEQEADATTLITDTGTVTFQFATDKTNTTGRFRSVLLLKRDNRFKQVRTSIGTVVTTCSFFDQALGGNPAIFQSF